MIWATIFQRREKHREKTNASTNELTSKKERKNYAQTHSLKCPSTLYEIGDDFPMTRKMERLTQKAKTPLKAIADIDSTEIG
jgi:hypothetical protein